MFTASDQASAAKNAVIGQTAAENLFGPGVDPIGQIVRIRDAPFTIVGVLERKGQNAMGSDQDDGLFIPLSAFQTRMQRGLGKFVPGRIFGERRVPRSHSARAPGDRRSCCANGIGWGPTTKTTSPPAAWRR